MINLHLESFKNNLFDLDFSISKKRVSTVKSSQEDEFFCTVMKYIFFRDSCSVPYTKTLLKVSDHVLEKNSISVNNLEQSLINTQPPYYDCNGPAQFYTEEDCD